MLCAVLKELHMIFLSNISQICNALSSMSFYFSRARQLQELPGGACILIQCLPAAAQLWCVGAGATGVNAAAGGKKVKNTLT